MITRRTMLATTAGAAVTLVGSSLPPVAQDAVADEGADAAGYAIFRVRGLPTPELAGAITANVMADFVPNLREVPGYIGYVLAFDADNPAALLTLAFTADESGAEGFTSVSTDFVSTLDPRFDPKLLNQTDGVVRSWTVTGRSTGELPPNLTGCSIAMRYRDSVEGLDIEQFVTLVHDGLVPLLREMPGFVMYALVMTENGRAGINIWETADQLDAGDQVVADWAAEYVPNTWVGDVTEHKGPIYFAELAGLNRA